MNRASRRRRSIISLLSPNIFCRTAKLFSISNRFRLRWWWWWNSKKSVQQGLETWSYRRECSGHNSTKKFCYNWGNFEHKRKTRRDEINTICCCSNSLNSSRGIIVFCSTSRKSGNQDRHREQGQAEDNRRKETNSQSTSVQTVIFLRRILQEILNVFSLDRSWKWKSFDHSLMTTLHYVLECYSITFCSCLYSSARSSRCSLDVARTSKKMFLTFALLLTAVASMDDTFGAGCEATATFRKGAHHFSSFNFSLLSSRSRNWILCVFSSSSVHLPRTFAVLIQFLLICMLIAVTFSVSSSICFRNSLMSSSHLFLDLSIDLLVLYFELSCGLHFVALIIHLSFCDVAILIVSPHFIFFESTSIILSSRFQSFL